MSEELGYAEGEICHREGCVGIVETHPSDNCSCHISPPCGSCTSPRNFCPDCGWEEMDEEVSYSSGGWHIVDYPQTRTLDRSKIDYRIIPHSGCSQICEGVFPIGTSMADVRKQVDGTFGGRFEYFNISSGTFKFIAYTD